MTFPTIRPALTLDFQKSRKLDPRITFSRSSTATYLDPATGLIKTAPDGVARFEKEGLLVEESRTNYVTDNDQALVSQGNVTVSQVPGPDGVSTSATRMTSSAAGNAIARNATNRTIVWGSQAVTTWSYFFKPVNLPESVVYLGVVAGAGQGTVSVDYINGTVTLSGNATAAGSYEVGNGWYRVWVTYSDVLSNTAAMRLNAQFVATDAGQYMDVYGMQMEVGSFSTSYIPTAGSTVTRAADVASITGTNFSSWFNQVEGAILAEVYPVNPTQGGVWGPINSGGSPLGQGFVMQASKAQLRIVNYLDSGSSDNDIVFNSPLVGGNKWAIAGSISDDTTGAYFNGSTGKVNASRAQGYGSVAGVTLGIHSGQRLTGHISRLAYYPERVSDESLEVLTA